MSKEKAKPKTDAREFIITPDENLIAMIAAHKEYVKQAGELAKVLSEMLKAFAPLIPVLVKQAEKNINEH